MNTRRCSRSTHPRPAPRSDWARAGRAPDLRDSRHRAFALVSHRFPRSLERPRVAEAGRGGHAGRARARGGRQRWRRRRPTPEPPAARRGHFPSSIGLSVLVSGSAQELRVTARWGDYTPIEKDGKPTGEWQRHERKRRSRFGSVATKRIRHPHRSRTATASRSSRPSAVSVVSRVSAACPRACSRCLCFS